MGNQDTSVESRQSRLGRLAKLWFWTAVVASSGLFLVNRHTSLFNVVLDSTLWQQGLAVCLVLAASLPAAVFITVIGHELGHVVCGRLAGYAIERVSFGSGRNLLSWRMGETLIEVNTGILDGQVAPRSAANPDSGFRQMLFCLGGVLANFTFMTGALLAWIWVSMPMWGQLVSCSLVLTNLLYLFSLYPVAALLDGEYSLTDGYQVVLIWRVGPKHADQHDYQAMVWPFFTEEFEAAPSRAAPEIVRLVRAIRMAAWQRGAGDEGYRKSLAGVLERGGLTKAEELLVLDVLGASGKGIIEEKSSAAHMRAEPLEGH